MGDNGNNQVEAVYTGQQQYGNPLEHWDPDFKPAPSSNNISQIYYLPEIDNMAGVLIRSNLTNEEQIDNLVMIIALCVEHHDNIHLELFRMKLSALPAIGGKSRTEGLMGGTGVVSSDLWRAAQGYPKRKYDDDKTYQRSDFRSDGKTINEPSQ